MVKWRDHERGAFRPPEIQTVSEWAEKTIVIPKLTSPLPGPMRIIHTPYIKGPLDAFGCSHIEEIDLVWGRQTGKSQGVIYPCVGYTIEQDQGPAIFMFPTEDLAKYTSKNRLQPMIDASPMLAMQKTGNKDDYTLLEMKFISMVLSLIGGGSESQVMSRPARYLFRDETDAVVETVGRGDTDPMKSIEETTSTFWDKTILNTSTPTNQDGFIWRKTKAAQAVLEFWVPCPHCGKEQVLMWRGIDFMGERDPEKVVSLACYRCQHCEEPVYEHHKRRMITDGTWRANLVEGPADVILKDKDRHIKDTITLDEVLEDEYYRHISFHLPKWYSIVSNATFGQAAKEFLDAQGNFEAMRDWTKFWRAVPWTDRAESKSEEELLAHKCDIPPLAVPQDTIALTLGIDPGQGGWWYTVWAHNRERQRHLIEYGHITRRPLVRDLLWENQYLSECGEWAYQVWRAGMDTGGSKEKHEDETMTERAYLFIREFGGAKLFGTKGMSRKGESKMQHKVIDKMPGKNGVPIPGGLTQWNLNPDMLKDAFQFYLSIPLGEPGCVYFHSDTGIEFIKHLLGEERRRDKKGKWEWVEVGDNHWLDCSLIALAMADPECWGGVSVLRDPQRYKVHKDDEEHRQREENKRESFVGAKRRGWIRGE